jgi:hypothetical protein
MITQHMLFIGFSLNDTNFVTIASTVKKVRKNERLIHKEASKLAIILSGPYGSNTLGPTLRYCSAVDPKSTLR